MKHNKIYKDGKYQPQRMCVACRKVMPKDQLIKVTFDGTTVSVSNGNYATGRGAYLCKSIECIQKAQKIRGLERGLKSEVSEDVYKECIEVYDK